MTYLAEMAIGFTLPFQIATGSLGIFRVTEDELSAIESDIRSLLVTNWGERVMHYNFGCNLREFIFEQKTEELRSSIADRINSQFAIWLPFLLIDELNIIFESDGLSRDMPENGVLIVMRYRLTNKPDLQGNTSFLVV